MRDPETFEARLAGAIRRYSANDPRHTDGATLARTIAGDARAERSSALGARLSSRPMPVSARVLLVAALLALLVASAAVVGSRLLGPNPTLPIGPGHATFSLTGPMSTPHGRAFTATLLPDGRVLVVGGLRQASRPVSTAEIWDPDTGTFSVTGSLAVARGDHTATLLSDGRVLVVGGYGDVGGGGSMSVASAEVWDPVSGAFGPAGSLSASRKQHTATLLPDGRVLIAFGTDDIYEVLPVAEIWDPRPDAFSALGPPVPGIRGRTATLLDDGSVLITGGYGGQVDAAAAELWDPVSEAFSATGSLATARAFHTAMLLSDGRVLVVGGEGGDATISSGEIWDPETRGFTTAAPIRGPIDGSSAVLLDDGRVLLVGGVDEIWDPVSGAIQPAGSLVEGRTDPSLTSLPDDRVLVVGGYGPEPPPTPDRCERRSGGITRCTAVDTALMSAELWSPGPSSR